MPSPALTARLKALILPPRPDPARSRRIAEGRLLVSAVIVLGVFSAIAVRVLMLAVRDFRVPACVPKKPLGVVE